MRRVLLALALVVTGCGPYIDEVNAAHKARLEAKLEQVGRVGKALATQPPLAADRLPLPPAVLGYSWPAQKPSNAAFIYAEDFGNLDQLGWVYGRAHLAGLVARCSSLLHTEREPWDPAEPATAPHPGFGFEAEKVFDACEKLEYLFVIRTRAFAKPVEAHVRAPVWVVPSVPDAGTDAALPDGGVADAGSGDAQPKLDAGPVGHADAGGDASIADAGAEGGTWYQSKDYEFEGGYLDAEILVFELASARFVGGFTIQVQSSPSLKGKATGYDLERDFREQVEAELSRAVHKRAPEVVQRM